MADLGQAYVQIVPKATGISNKISDLVTPGSAKAGQSAGASIAGGLKKAIVAAGIGAAVVTVIKGALSEGAKLQQSYGGLETIYGKAADQAKEYAKQASKAGISANDYAEQAVSFGASLKQAFGGDTTKAVEAANTAIMDMTDNAAKMGTPIESIQNAYQGFAKQNYTMLDNLKLGYGGTQKEMQRLLKDASKLTGKKYDISNLGDVYEAVHVIQGELGLTGVAAEEASTTFEGSFNAMKASASNLLGALALGEDVGPAMSGLIDSVINFLTNNLVPMIANVFRSLPDVVSAIVENAPALLMAGLELIDALAQGLYEGISTLVAPAVKAIVATIENIISSIKGFFANVWASIKATASNVWNSIKATATSVWNAIKTAVMTPINAVKSFLSSAWSSIKAKASSAWTAIKSAMIKPIEAAKDKIKGIIDKVRSIFPLHIGKIFDAIKLPHISVSGGKAPFGIGGKGSLPKFSVTWAAKGGLVDGATLIGAGEKGSEAIVPLDPFWDKMDKALAEDRIDYDKMAYAMLKALSLANNTVELVCDGRVIARATAPYMQTEMSTLTTRQNRKLGYVGV